MPYRNSIQEMAFEEGFQQGLKEAGMAKGWQLAIIETVKIRFNVSEQVIAPDIENKSELDELKAISKVAVTAGDFKSFKRLAGLE